MKSTEFTPCELSSAPGQFSCFHAKCTASTMSDARRLCALSQRGVVYADEQTGGRGRLEGRKWDCTSGEGLLATFWFPASDFGTRPAPILAGLAVLDALKALLPEASLCAKKPLLKWPNDILIEGQKTAGILCETALSSVLVGIGVNLTQKTFPTEYKTPPTSLLQTYGVRLPREGLLAALVRAFGRCLQESFPWREEAEANLAYRGLTVRFKRGIGENELVRGKLAGLTEQGYLILETDAGLCVEPSGELCAAEGLTQRFL